MIEPRIQAFDIVQEISPPISTLRADELTDEKHRTVSNTARRLLLIGICVSVLVHLVVALIMVKVSRHRTISISEAPRVSVQIRITGPRPVPAVAPEPAIRVTDTDTSPATESEQPTSTSTETNSSAAITLEPVNIQPIVDDTALTNSELIGPSTMDIRQAVRSLNTAGDRQPDCTPWMRRNEMFTQCEPNVDQADYDQASRTATLAPLIPSQAPVEPTLPADATDPGQRLRSLIDRVDDQLSTSRTRRAIMQLP